MMPKGLLLFLKLDFKPLYLIYKMLFELDNSNHSIAGIARLQQFCIRHKRVCVLEAQ